MGIHIIDKPFELFIELKDLYESYILNNYDNKIRVKIMYIINENNDSWEMNQSFGNMLKDSPDDFISSLQFFSYLNGYNLTQERKIMASELLLIEAHIKDKGMLREPTHLERFEEYKKQYL